MILPQTVTVGGVAIPAGCGAKDLPRREFSIRPGTDPIEQARPKPAMFSADPPEMRVDESGSLLRQVSQNKKRKRRTPQSRDTPPLLLALIAGVQYAEAASTRAPNQH